MDAIFKSILIVATFIVTVIINSICEILFQEPIYFILARILSGKLSPKQSLRGVWECCYRYPDKGNFKYEQQLICISQIGPFVIARNLKSQSHIHRLSGKLNNSIYLTGRWYNIPEGEIRHGAFQFVVDNKTENMHGEWLGFDSNKVIQHGPWAWKLISRKTSKIIMNRLLKDWTPNPELIILCLPPEESLKELILKYGRAWQNQDVNLLPSIFTEGAIYQERAFERAMIGLPSIREYWKSKVLTQQNNIQFRFISVNGGVDKGIAEWEVEFDDLSQKEVVRKKIREVAILELVDGKISSLREFWSSKRINIKT